jgi:hypothetical protein
MERHQTGSATGKTQPAGNIRRVTSTLVEKRSNAAGKLTRKQVSDCINIWATVYHLRDADTEASQLCLPPAPWTGRDPSGNGKRLRK